MPVYTRSGDNGLTSLYGGKRVSKSDIKVEAYGTVDELSSFLGLIVSKIKNKSDKEFLIEVQKNLYKIMSVLSGMDLDLNFLDIKIKDFENKIDKIDKKLPRLNKFIIPGGRELSSLFHISRVVCRRSERAVVRLNMSNNKLNTIRYLNRLSDLLFVLARYYNQGKEILV